MSELPTSPEHHPLRPTLEGAAQTTLTLHFFLHLKHDIAPERFAELVLTGQTHCALLLEAGCRLSELVAQLSPGRPACSTVFVRTNPAFVSHALGPIRWDRGSHLVLKPGQPPDNRLSIALPA